MLTFLKTLMNRWPLRWPHPRRRPAAEHEQARRDFEAGWHAACAATRRTELLMLGVPLRERTREEIHRDIAHHESEALANGFDPLGRHINILPTMPYLTRRK